MHLRLCQSIKPVMGQQEQDISDESLMERVCSGDHQAFAQIVERHSGLFYSAAYRMCGHSEEAEDIVQEAFLKLWSKPEGYDAAKGAKFTTWFYRVVTNLAIDRMRRKKPQSGGSEALEYIADKTPSAESRLEEQDRQDALEAAIAALPERQKIALNLCFYEGLSNKEAAEILGVGVKALESLLMRAKKALRDDLMAQGFLEAEEGLRVTG
ncbi:MAG: sigma-70 family RNA polymerase sigma factor [Alphaproteobacteria bacterium]